MKREIAWLWIIVAIGAALRLYRLDYQSLWNDEGLLYFIASGDSLATVLDRARWRTWHPPLSFIIHHLFLIAGDSDFFVRLPACLFGIGSLPLCYVLMKRLTSTNTALCAVFLLAISPFHVWYSQEGRMYSQMLFLALLSSIVFLRAVESKRRWFWGLYALVVTAGVYTHALMVFAVLAHVVWLALYDRRQFLAMVGSGIVVVILVSPWILSSSAVRNFVSKSKPRTFAGSISSGFSIEVLPYTFYTYAAGFSLGPSVAELHEDRSLSFLLQFLPELLTVGLVFGVLLLIGTWELWSKCNPKNTAFIASSLIAPIAGAALFALFPAGLYNVRYTIIALPFFCVIVGAALPYAMARRPLLGAVALLAVMGISAVSLYNHYSNPRYAKDDVKSAVAAWRSMSPRTYLVSAVPGGIRDAIEKYLEKEERERHVALGKSNTLMKTQEFFATKKARSAHILLSRDWHQVRENAVRKSFAVVDEKEFPGVKLLRITPP